MWDAWSASVNPQIYFRYPVSYRYTSVTVGMDLYNSESGVSEPSQIVVSFSNDGTTWGGALTFQTSNGSLPTLPDQQRSDVVLNLGNQGSQYVQLAFTNNLGWMFLDEISFNASILTAVELKSFKAVRGANGVQLDWETGYDPRRVGFYLLREQNGIQTQLNDEMILALSGGDFAGSYADTLPGWDGAVLYSLKDVAEDGTFAIYGPYAPVESTGPDLGGTMSDLGTGPRDLDAESEQGQMLKNGGGCVLGAADSSVLSPLALLLLALLRPRKRSDRR